MASGDVRKVHSTVSNFDCHQCSASFNIKSDLLEHIKSDKHDVVKVICPFCVAKDPRVFKRVGDLRLHARKKHPKEVQAAPKGLFTTRTAFYFSTEPHKYIKDHKPEHYNDKTSVYARDLVTKWTAGRTPGVTKWIEGWQLAKGQTNVSAKRSSTSLELIDVNSSPMEIRAHFSLGDSYVMAKVDLGISDDYRGMDSLTRRSRTLKPAVLVPTGSWKMLHKPETKSEAAALLGIQERYINIILHKPKPHFQCKIAKTAAAEDESKGQTSPGIPSEEPSSPEAATNDIMEDLLQTCGILPPLSPIPSPTPIHLDVAVDDVPAEQEDPTPLDSSPRNKTTIPSTESSCTDDILQTDIATPRCNSPVTTQTFSAEIHDSNGTESQTVPYEPAMLGDGNTQIIAEYTPTPILNADDVKTKAVKILRTGCMPLLPPCRRDWTAVPEESIQLTGDLKWPPVNWKTMSPDQKCLSVEFAAITLSRQSSQCSNLLKDRFTLVHEFNFLVLPGSGPYRTDIKSKARIYNYQAVLEIACGKDRSTLAEQMDFLNCFNFTGHKSNDHLLQKLSQIPLKLK